MKLLGLQSKYPILQIDFCSSPRTPIGTHADWQRPPPHLFSSLSFKVAIQLKCNVDLQYQQLRQCALCSHCECVNRSVLTLGIRNICHPINLFINQQHRQINHLTASPSPPSEINRVRTVPKPPQNRPILRRLFSHSAKFNRIYSWPCKDRLFFSYSRVNRLTNNVKGLSETAVRVSDRNISGQGL